MYVQVCMHVVVEEYTYCKHTHTPHRPKTEMQKKKKKTGMDDYYPYLDVRTVSIIYKQIIIFPDIVDMMTRRNSFVVKHEISLDYITLENALFVPPVPTM